MLNLPYILSIISSFVIGFILLHFILRKQGITQMVAPVAFIICLSLSIACAWGLYQAIMFKVPVSSYRYSFVGGVIGAILGLVLTSGIMHFPCKKLLNASAIPMSLMIALARMSEYFLSQVGWGQNLPEGSWLCKTPLAVAMVWDEWYTEWYLAVYIIEAVFALAAMITAIIGYRNHREDLFRQTVYLLVIPQILAEQLRIMPMAWGFVKVEQILCAVIGLVCLLHACKVKQTRWPIAVFVACIAVIVAAEFALDGKISLSNQLSYRMLILALLMMLLLEALLSRKKDR